MNAPAPVTAVNDIPVYLAPPVDGRWAGGLTFRVGHADETLATSGITHLTEHLALHFSDPTKVHSNGATGPNLTNFHIGGTPEEVVTFLNEVAAALRDLPLDRLATEKQILRAEAARMRGGPADGIQGWRHGARDYGLPSFAELGLHRLTTDDLAAWAARWFTAGNAVAWLAADSVPDDLDLRLPEGDRMPPPPIDPWLPEAPAHYVGPEGFVATTSLIPRSTAGRIYASVIEQSLYRELRLIGGYSYSPSAGYDPLDASTAQLFAAADCLPEYQDAVVGGLVDVLARLRLGEIQAEDVAAAVENAREMLQHPDVETMRLPSAVADDLLGHDLLSIEELLAELDAVDTDAVREVAHQAHATALVQAPGKPLDWAGYVAAPEWNDQTVDGSRYPFIEDSDYAIVVGEQGIAADVPGGRSAVRWSNVAAALRFPDGARSIIGTDGFQVHVEPTVLSANGQPVTEMVDRWTPPESVVELPARDPDAIPPVPETPAPSEKAEKEDWDSLRRWLLITAVAVLGVIILRLLG